tara:strand:- start:4329 stop:4532 length:204 start_codon:yes stop_codon:yes gene_type:complete
MDIVCIDNTLQETCLTLGKIYKDVILIAGKNYYMVVDDYGIPNQFYNIDRFIPVEEYREQVINNILI